MVNVENEGNTKRGRRAIGSKEVTISRREYDRLQRLASLGQEREGRIARVEEAIEDATNEMRLLSDRSDGLIGRLSGEFGQIMGNRRADLGTFIRGMKVGLGRESADSFLSNGGFYSRERIAEMRQARVQEGGRA